MHLKKKKGDQVLCWSNNHWYVAKIRQVNQSAGDGVQATLNMVYYAGFNNRSVEAQHFPETMIEFECQGKPLAQMFDFQVHLFEKHSSVLYAALLNKEKATYIKLFEHLERMLVQKEMTIQDSTL
jgi:hypothetical protein